MAVDTTQIGSVYDSLETKIKATLDEQWNNGRLTGSDYAQVLSGTLTQAMQLAVQSVQNQPTIDADIATKNAQKTLIDQQKITEVNRGTFIARQTTAYDDKLRIEEAKQLANIMGMFGAGGTALPTGLNTTTLNAIAAITP